MKPCDRLKIVRDDLGKTQPDMADLVKVNFRTYQNYENGRSDIKPDVLEALARLGYNLNWLLTGEGEMKRGEGQEGGEEGAQPIKARAPELDLELLERIIVKIIKYQRETGDPAHDLLAEVLARTTASAIINTYKTCLGMPSATLDEIINNYSRMIGTVVDNLNDIAEEKGLK